jgi:heat shock protein HslJ
MLMKIGLMAGLAIFTLSVGACGASSAGIDLDGTQWVLVEMAGEAPLPGRQITLGFEDGEVRGHLGCNSLSGPYSLRGDKLEFGVLMTTLMACVEDEFMQQESRMFELLGMVERVQLIDGRLHLVLTDGNQLIYEPAE